MKDKHGYVEAIGALVISLLAIGIGWWGLTVIGTSSFVGLAALGFACFLFTPVAWLGARVYGAAVSGSAGAVMMVVAAIMSSIHP
jgi:hypothetical protein